MVLVVTVVALIAVAGAGGLGGLLPNLNPFASETKDRSQPAVLRSLERLSEYRAATANLQVIVDIEKDANYLPPFIKGERTLLVAAGNVDAVVDFNRLDRRSVAVSRDRKTVTVQLPAARLSEARLDLERTRVYDRDRGVLDRIGGVLDDDRDRDRELFALAERKLRDAAAADGSLRGAAQRNTELMLSNLLRAVGFKRIDVQFAAPAS
jgi:Protein of unknown function (DUF4230)